MDPGRRTRQFTFYIDNARLGVDQLSACAGAGNLLHWGVIRSTRARVVSVVGFLVGKPGRAMETTFRINRLRASSSPLLGANFRHLPYSYHVISSVLPMQWRHLLEIRSSEVGDSEVRGGSRYALVQKNLSGLYQLATSRAVGPVPLG